MADEPRGPRHLPRFLAARDLAADNGARGRVGEELELLGAKGNEAIANLVAASALGKGKVGLDAYDSFCEKKIYEASMI